MARYSLSFPLSCSLLFLLSGCATGFTVQATTEESKILADKESLESLLEKTGTSQELRQKFELVIKVREFAKTHGLRPGGSFTEYAKIDRDVLVWVLSAAPATSLEPYTWWFPIVGTIPYKGFFEKQEAKDTEAQLKANGYDTFLRPSPAFSTLGWFKDPLLSTYAHFDDIDLVVTVFHEIFHNTVWIPGDAFFNESAANVIGYLFAARFFEQQCDIDKANQIHSLLSDELIFAQFLRELSEKLTIIYQQEEITEQRKLQAKNETLSWAAKYWEDKQNSLQTNNYRSIIKAMNNASIVAFGIYLKDPELFLKLYQRCHDLNELVAKLKEIEITAKKGDTEPYQILRNLLVDDKEE